MSAEYRPKYIYLLAYASVVSNREREVGVRSLFFFARKLTERKFLFLASQR